MGLCFLLQNGKQCLDRCRERDIYNYNISYYREKIYGIYRTYRSFVDKAITMRKLLYWCPMCCLPDEVEAKVLLSQLRVQLIRIMFTRQVYTAQTQYQELKNVYCRAV